MICWPDLDKDICADNVFMIQSPVAGGWLAQVLVPFRTRCNPQFLVGIFPPKTPPRRELR